MWVGNSFRELCEVSADHVDEALVLRRVASSEPIEDVELLLKRFPLFVALGHGGMHSYAPKNACDV